MAGEVKRVDGAAGGQRLDIEQPVVEVTAEAVQQDERLAALAGTQEPQRARVDCHGLRRRPRLLLGLPGHEARLEVGHEGIDVRLGDIGLGDHAEQAADGDNVALGGHAPAQDPSHGGLDRAVDLLRLDLGHLVTDGELRALVHQPLEDPALGHGQAPLGHAQLLDVRAHRALAVAAPATSRTASAIFSGDGT